MTTINITRRLPKGSQNPNTKKIYTNMDEKVQEAIEEHGGKLPVTLPYVGGGSLTELTTIKPEEVVGYITSLDDFNVHVELTALGLEMLSRNELFGKCAQFHFIVNEPDTSDKVVLVLRASIAPIIPVTVTAEIHITQGGTNHERQEECLDECRESDRGTEEESVQPLLQERLPDAGVRRPGGQGLQGQEVAAEE